MTTYHVHYFNGYEEKIFTVVSHSKQQAYNRFRKVVNKRYEVLDIVDYSKVLMRKRVAFYAVVVAIAVVLLNIIVFSIFGEPTPVSYTSYVVEPGDTLWEIARMSNGWSNIDGQTIVYHIMNYSNCSGDIRPGQIVYVPQYH